MKLPWIRASLLSALVLGFHQSGTNAFANWGRSGAVVSETVLGVPTSYVLPTAYLAETSYAVPTTYVYPTAAYYTPTSFTETSYLLSTSASYLLPTSASYLLPTSYATIYDSPTVSLTPTAYVAPAYTTGYYYRRPGLLGRLFGRRNYVATSSSYYAPTSYVTTSAYYPTTYALPTSYAYPTLYDFPVATTATQTACCGTMTSVAAVQAPSNSSRVAPVRPSTPSGHRERTPAPVIESSPNANEPDLEETPPPTKSRSTAPADTSNDLPVPPGPVGPEKDELAPAPPLEKSTAQPTPPPATPGGADKDKIQLPAPVDAPAEQPKGAVFQVPGGSRYVTGRPKFYTPVSASGRSLLEGTVIDSESRQAEEGVRVILTSRSGAFTERVLTTNNLGQYAVRLPDGDWTVKVTMPSGRVYAVSELTISNGTIIDDRGRDIPSLTIRR